MKINIRQLEKKSIAERIFVLAAIMESFANQRILKPQGLSFSGYKILAMLDRYKKLPFNDIMDCLNSTKSNLSQRIKHLEKKRYVKKFHQKNNKDKRMIAIEMTAFGKKKFKAAQSEIEKSALVIESYLGDEDISRFNVFFKKLFPYLIESKNQDMK